MELWKQCFDWVLLGYRRSYLRTSAAPKLGTGSLQVATLALLCEGSGVEQMNK